MKEANETAELVDENEVVDEEITIAIRNLEPIQKQMVRALILGYIAGHDQQHRKVSETA